MRRSAFLILVLTAPVLVGCVSHVEMSDAVMGTTMKVEAVSRSMSKDELNKAVLEAIEAAKTVDRLMSTWKPDSEISRLNRAKPKEWVELSPETYEVLVLAVEVSKQAEGAFDITVGPLVDLWGFGPKSPALPTKVPSDEAIADAIANVGHEHIVIDANSKRAYRDTEGVEVDLGGIAKGYAVDQVLKALQAKGIKDALVEIGGETAAIGLTETRDPWLIGIRHPNRTRELLTTIELKDAAIATSGDYFNVYELRGRLYSHIIDPRMGKPITNNVCSVTVIAKTCAYADALATGLMVLGPDKGLKLVESLKGVEAIFAWRTGKDTIEVKATTGARQHRLTP
ncbi:MAG: FAD:protein FMN transferase [Verrucomicrobia bacterium]|nr:FAD:protein FMN transferase [Verrucomicrobiota bacterium]